MESEKIITDRPRWYDDACGTALALEFLGERWSLLVLRELMYGPRRFGEIRANLPGISANVLTQRLDGLARAGILVRRRLPSPANVGVYQLTAWGLETRPIIRDLGRWAARSSRHDPMLFMSPASAMMSLETLADPVRLAALPGPITVAFRFPDDHFVARAEPGHLAIRRDDAGAGDAVLAGDTMAMRMTIYGKVPFGDPAGMAVTGDSAAAAQFADLFALPDKVA